MPMPNAWKLGKNVRKAFSGSRASGSVYLLCRAWALNE